MNVTQFINKAKFLLPRNDIFLQPRAWLNRRRKAERKRNSLEPGRRVNAFFENPNSHPALLNGPDYTFLDHRPVPYRFGQFKRISQSIEHTQQIIQFNKEIDIALEMERTAVEKNKAEIQNVLSRKLKPKGGIIEESGKRKETKT